MVLQFPVVVFFFAFFFFSSRRRHSRCGRDWSSDVCSSDLERARAMEGSMAVIEEVHDEFAKIFGRRYDPWVEEFMTEGADVVFFMQGGHAVTARHAIRHLRDQGAKVGLVRFRTIRP